MPSASADMPVPSIVQKHTLLFTMKDIRIRGTKKASFLILGNAASIPRNVVYIFGSVAQHNHRPKQLACEQSFTSRLADMGWEFPDVSFGGALLTSLATETA